jgi:hypothetical protein
MELRLEYRQDYQPAEMLRPDWTGPSLTYPSLERLSPTTQELARLLHHGNAP